MSDSYEFSEPDHFTAGAVGPPGRRVFYLQARGDGIVLTMKVEKQQVAALADYLAGIMEDLPAPDEAAVPSDVDLIEPVIPAFTVGSLGVAWDERADRVVLVAEALTDQAEDDEDPEESGSSARLRITREQVAAFVAHAQDLVAAGRPPCPICGGPMDPEGHVCPRSNGHRRSGRGPG